VGPPPASVLLIVTIFHAASNTWASFTCRTSPATTT
jgi:hypothetical protein